MEESLENNNSDSVDLYEMTTWMWSQRNFLTLFSSIAAIISVTDALILPNNNLAYTSILLLIISIPNFINDKLNLELYNYIGNYYYELLTFNFIRLSELQELIFAFYFLNYMIEFKKNIQT